MKDHATVFKLMSPGDKERSMTGASPIVEEWIHTAL